MARNFLLTIKAQDIKKILTLPGSASPDDISRVMFREMIKSICWTWKELLEKDPKGWASPPGLDINLPQYEQPSDSHEE